MTKNSEPRKPETTTAAPHNAAWEISQTVGHIDRALIHLGRALDDAPSYLVGPGMFARTELKRCRKRLANIYQVLSGERRP